MHASKTIKFIHSKRRRAIYISYIISFVFVVINFTGYFVTELVRREFAYSPKIGLLYGLSLLNLLFWTFYGLVFILRSYKKTKLIREKNQLRYFFIAATIGIVFGMLPNTLFGLGIKIYPIGGFSTVAYIAIVAYAIVQYQLMDIEIIIKKGIVYGSLTASITVIYALIVGIFYWIFGTTFAQGSLLINGLAAMVIAITFSPLKNNIQLAVDKIFFKDKYDYSKTLRDFSSALTSILDLNTLLNLIVNKVTDIMHIDKGYIMLLDDKNEKFQDDYLVEWLKRNKTVFIREEFEFNLESGRFSNKEDEYKKIVETLTNLKKQGISLAVPIIYKNELIGIFNLGSKMSEDMYSSNDIALLTTVANQASVAIENAKLYEEQSELEKSLHQSDKLVALGTLASSIAHEIRNPLVSIKTFTQLLPQKYESKEFIQKFNDIVPKEVERLENFLSELLNYSKRSKTEIQQINIEETINGLLVLLSSEISRYKVKVSREFRNIPKISGNGEQLRQVFMNVILNAVQSMTYGGKLSIRTNATPSPDPRWVASPLKGEDKFVEIEFEDTGCGIPKEHMNSLFNPFFTTKEGGTGLGLSISRKIVKDHKGTIEVKSPILPDGTGTLFIIRLPVDNSA